MARRSWRRMAAGVIGGAVVAGAIGGASCGGNSSYGGASVTGAGAGDAGSPVVFTMQLSGADEVPPNPSTATGMVQVTLDRSTGQLTVTGSFLGLSSNAIAAHINGPAAAGSNAPVVFPLTVPVSTSGTVSGSGTMDVSHMSDVVSGMTYVNVDTMDYPSGELRAQIGP